MLKYFFAFLLLFSFTFTACEDDPMPPEDQPPAPPAPGAQEAPIEPDISDADVSEEELEKFAMVNIRADREQVSPQEDPEGFVDLVEDEGLDADEYMDIHSAIQQDPQLQQEVQRLFRELQ